MAAMTQGKPTPQYKFRLLCRRCNSYMHTMIDNEPDGLRLWCEKCGTKADDLDEVAE
jgi:ribosomal protein L44E